MSPDRKKIQKIFDQINKLAIKGKDNVIEYYKLIDELIQKGEYNYLELTLYYGYFIDINIYQTIEDMRKNTWSEIVFQTNSSLSKKIKRVLDDNDVYQVSFKFYKSDDNQYLGDVLEFDKLSEDSKYYFLNKEYAKLIGTRVTYLEVNKVGATSSLIIDAELPNATEEQNLVNRYKIAVSYLIS